MTPLWNSLFVNLAAQSGYGTNKTRLGKDSVGDFDCCCLTLQPCANPVITYVLYIPYSQRTPPVRHFECQKRAEKDGVCDAPVFTLRDVHSGLTVPRVDSFIPLDEEEQLLEKYLAWGHKCHDWDSNRHPDDLKAVDTIISITPYLVTSNRRGW